MILTAGKKPKSCIPYLCCSGRKTRHYPASAKSASARISVSSTSSALLMACNMHMSLQQKTVPPKQSLPTLRTDRATCLGTAESPGKGSSPSLGQLKLEERACSMSFESYGHPRTRTNQGLQSRSTSTAQPQTNLHMLRSGEAANSPSALPVVGSRKVNKPAEAFFSVSEPHSTWTATQIH